MTEICRCRDRGRDTSLCQLHGPHTYNKEDYMKVQQKMEKFETGATRDISTSKIDYEAFLSPLVLDAYGRFMHYNREMEDGTLRAGDNWQLGIPPQNYMKSAWRHFLDWWLYHRQYQHLMKQTIVWTLCAVIFNASGYLHELLKNDPYLLDANEEVEKQARLDRRAGLLT